MVYWRIGILEQMFDLYEMDGNVYCAGSSRMWPTQAHTYCLHAYAYESKSTCFHIEMKFGPSVGERRKMNTICYRFAHVTRKPRKETTSMEN